MIRFEPCGLVGDVGVADGVGLVKGVAGEGLDQVEDRFGVALRIAERLSAAEELAAFGLHDLGDLLAHRLTHDIGLAERVAGELAGDVEDLVLVDDHSIGVVEALCEVGVGDR